VITYFKGTGIVGTEGITAGPDGALWFANSGTQCCSPPSIGRITTAGVVSNYTTPNIIAPTGLTAGPDGALWFTNFDSIGRITTADSVVTSPDQGPIGTPVTITGRGFNAGETVKVKLSTGSSPASVPLCSATAAGNGTFSCTAPVPAATGSPGTHTVEAKGKTSGTKANSIFLLTD
jgi:virginiamycin B lyase